MATINQIYFFYLAIIVILSLLTFFGLDDNQMIYSMCAAILGAVISIFLWLNYGSAMVVIAESS
jgi:hypothetical protein